MNPYEPPKTNAVDKASYDRGYRAGYSEAMVGNWLFYLMAAEMAVVAVLLGLKRFGFI